MKNSLQPQHSLSEVAEFILSFIQALLKTGYYTPGHPQAQKAKEGLYLDLKRVLEGRKEATFVSVTEKDIKDVIVDGIFDEPTQLSGLMLKGMAEMFVPKFLEYFERKHLASFSIKYQITEKEFESFINIMSEFPYEEDKSDTLRERMAFELIKNNIVSVSTVFNVDLVGRHRKLPWRVELALTRLKNDLGKIPLYKNLSEEKIAEIKAMVFDDIIRPVKIPTLIKDILANLDLILFDTMGMTKEELEDEITEYFHRDSLSRAAPELLKEYLKVKKAYEQFKKEDVLKHLESVREITERVARKIAEHQTEDESLLMEFVKHNLLSVDDLPEKNKGKARRIMAVDNFLQNPEAYYQAIEKASREELGQRCRMFVDLLPELLLRSCYNEIDDIIRVVKKAGFSFSMMERTFFDEISANIDLILEGSSKKDQLKIMEILNSMGEDSIPVLLDMLTAKSRLVRKIACEMLIDHDVNAVQHIMSVIDKKKEWYFTRNILMILAEIGHGGRETEDIFKKFLNHKEHRVREEVVKGFTNIMGIDAEEFLLDFLKDPSPSVRRKAVWGLGVIRSTRPEMTSYFSDVLSGRVEEDAPIIEQIFLALTLIGARLKDSEDLEDTIIKVLKGKGLGRLFTKGVDLSDKLKAKACEALGAFGTEKSIAVLKKLEKEKLQVLKGAANKAIEQINSRI